jgi:NarL family two-component system response regulator LiaR
MITILVVDDHTVFRQGIVSLFDGINDMRVIGETGSGQGAISLAINLIPDVILMDVSLPDMNGITAASHIKQAGLKTEIVLLTMYKENSWN